jgi:hypothetical protein
MLFLFLPVKKGKDGKFVIPGMKVPKSFKLQGKQPKTKIKVNGKKIPVYFGVRW